MKTSAEIKKAIKWIATTGAKLQEKIHETAVECLKHAATHGDATLMDQLVKALPAGQRVEALVLWTTAFSPIRWEKEDGQRAGVKLLSAKRKNYVPFDIDGAAAQPYYSFSKENEQKQMTLEQILKMVPGLIKRYETKKEEDLVPAEQQSAIESYLKALSAVQAPTITNATPANIN